MRTACSVNSARHERTGTVWSHSCEVPGGVRFTETESRGVVAGLERAGEVGVGRQMGVDRWDCCLMGAEHQCGKMEKF